MEESLKALVSGNFFVAPIKRGNITETRVQASTIEAYKKIAAELEKGRKPFYTFRLKIY